MLLALVGSTDFYFSDLGTVFVSRLWGDLLSTHQVMPIALLFYH
jgi:hypothetical protein